MDEDETKNIVLECGSAITKAGFAGDETPKAIFPTLFGHLKNLRDHQGEPNSNTYIGDQVLRQSADFIITSPIEHGIFTNFEDMEKLFHFIFFDELRCDPKDQRVLLIEPPKNPRYVREKQAEIMFETYNVSSFLVKESPILVLYSSGRNTGIILDIGEGITYVNPLYDGFTIIRGVKRQNFAGFDLNEYLEDLIQCEQGFAFNTSSDRQLVRDIKEKQCYVALDYDAEITKSKSEKTNDTTSSYFFADGTELKLSSERFKCPELLFKPHLNGFEFKGLHELVFNSIMKCDISSRADLLANVIVSGGSSKFPGLPNRLEAELKKLVSPKIRTKVVAPDCRDISAWIGGSILASLSTFPKMTVSRDEYNEKGKDVINENIF